MKPPQGPTKSQATPVSKGAVRCPARTEKLSRPAYRALPLIIWPTRAWAPIQPKLDEMPPSICSTTTAHSHGMIGNRKGVTAPMKANQISTRRVPSRSISAPPWMEKTMVGRWRTPRITPIIKGEAPR